MKAVITLCYVKLLAVGIDSKVLATAKLEIYEERKYNERECNDKA
ncbi:MAG: hypothetical protein ACI9LM_000294 [Alteromonadaceae bacterium]|jgi:hypothetical protein